MNGYCFVTRKASGGRQSRESSEGTKKNIRLGTQKLELMHLMDSGLSLIPLRAQYKKKQRTTGDSPWQSVLALIGILMTEENMFQEQNVLVVSRC
jgi:hypothetical protein